MNASSTVRVRVVVLQRVGKCVSVGGEIEYTGLTKTRSEKPRQVLGAEQLWEELSSFWPRLLLLASVLEAEKTDGRCM